MKKLIVMLLSIAMVVTMLAACGQGGGSAATTAAAGGNDQTTAAQTETTAEQLTADITADTVNRDAELTVGINADIGSFYPGGAGSAGVKLKRIMCYETLFYKDANKELHPLLAKSYEDLGNSTYSVELFDYIKDSEGNPMTAEDVIFSLDLYIEDGQNSSTWKTLENYHATGDYTFEFTLNPERTGQLEDIFSRIPIITKAAWESSPDEMATYPIGTGGYTLDQNKSVSGSMYVFNRRDDYWQTDEEYICERNIFNIKTLTAKVITDTSTLAAALERGEIDFTSEIDSNDWGMFMDENGVARDGYVAMESQNNAFVHMTFNCGENSPCKDIKLRQAIAYCIDSAACAYSVYGALGKACNAATNPYLEDSGLEFGHDDYFPYDPNLTEARKLVEESSYGGESLRVLILPRNTVSKCFPLIQAYCLQIGVNLEPLEYDMATFRTVRVEPTGTEYEIELLGATSADDYVNVSVKEIDNKAYGNGMGRCFVNDDKLQELYEATGNQDTNSPEAVQALLDYLEEQCYMYGLYYCPKMIIGSDKVKGGVVIPFDDAIYSAFVVE